MKTNPFFFFVLFFYWNRKSWMIIKEWTPNSVFFFPFKRKEKGSSLVFSFFFSSFFHFFAFFSFIFLVTFEYTNRRRCHNYLILNARLNEKLDLTIIYFDILKTYALAWWVRESNCLSMVTQKPNSSPEKLHL